MHFLSDTYEGSVHDKAIADDVAYPLPAGSEVESLEPWLTEHLPDLDRVARRHFLHLVTGIIKQQSVLVRAIAASSVFQAEPESNFTQVQRILRDTRLKLETTYYSLVARLLAAMLGDHAYLTLDQTCHTDRFNLVLVGWATDAVSLPLGFVVYADGPMRHAPCANGSSNSSQQAARSRSWPTESMPATRS